MFPQYFFYSIKQPAARILPGSRLIYFTQKLTNPVRELVILALTSSFRLLLTSYAWLLVMLSLTNFLLNASLCTVSFESA